MIGGSQATSWWVNLSLKLIKLSLTNTLGKDTWSPVYFLGLVVSLLDSSTRSNKLWYRLVLEPRLQSSRSGNQKYSPQQREVTGPHADQSVLWICTNTLGQVVSLFRGKSLLVRESSDLEGYESATDVLSATGIFAGSIATYIFRDNWRNQVLSGAIPAFILLILTFLCCE